MADVKKPKLQFKRLPDDEYIDEVSICLSPRYKTSGLSGDEWRVSAVMEFKRKGQIVWAKGFSTMQVAAMALPWFYRVAGEGTDGEFKHMDDSKLCDQPPCRDSFVSIYKIKQEYEEHSGTKKESVLGPMYRKFCQRHLKRGDCGLEDSDSNYEVVSGPGPDKAKGYGPDVQESVFGGVIEVGKKKE